MIITSASNDKIKDIRKLLKSARERQEKRLYVVEGIRMFREIPKERVKEIYVAESGVDKFDKEIREFGIEPCIVADKVFAGMSDTNTPQGIMALVSMCEYSLEAVSSKNGENEPFLLIVERLQDPGNLGTIIRTAEGSGVTGIVISSDSVDVYNPKTIRSTMGSVFRMPVYVSDDLLNDLKYIKKQGVTIYGAHLSGMNFYEKDFRTACGFLIGNEGNGLSDEVSSMADDLIRIPMLGKVESLNAATSTSVISYEVLRQRYYSS